MRNHCDEIKRNALANKIPVLDTNFVGKFIMNYKSPLNDEKLQEYY